MQRTFLLIAVLLITTLTSGCNRNSQDSQSSEKSVASPFINTDIAGLKYVWDFALPDHNGQIRTLADFKGKAVLVFFGYTQCPDVCPTTMSELAQVMKQLGPKADQLQVLFVTVDPARDTAALLSKYVPAFDPRFLGLSGTPAETEKIAKNFHVFYQKIPGKKKGTYTMDHTAGSYVFDPKGRIRLFIRNGQGPEPIVHDLNILFNES